MSSPGELTWVSPAQSRGGGQLWRRPIAGATRLWLGAHVTLVVVGVLTHLFSSDRRTFFANPDWFFSLYFHWDSDYFARIAQNGYFGAGSQQTTQAFFPGYPLASRAVATVLWGVHPTLSEIVIGLWFVAIVSSAIASILLWRLVEADYGARVAAAAVTLFVFGSYSLSLMASYSESLYLALAIAAWWAVRQNRWLVGGLFAAAASFTRINGAFLVIALVVMYVLHRRANRAPYLSRSVALGAIGLSGVASYFLYLFVETGSARAWFAAEAEGWNRSLTWPWATFVNTFNEALYAGNPDHRFQSTLDILVVPLVILAVIILVRNRNWPAAILVATTMLSMITSHSYLSVGRDTLVLFPLTILVASSLAFPRWKWVYWTYLVLGVALLIVEAHEFTLGHWTD
jgi:Gpi18-like mannosyltransferase